MGVKKSLFLFIFYIISTKETLSLKSDDILIIPQFPSINIREICANLFFEARPLPQSNQFFVGCIKGEGFILQCDMGKVFNPESLKCDYNEITTTTMEIPTSTPDYNELCRGLNFDFIEHPSDCGKLLFCFNGIPIPRECPPNTIFDINLRDCRSGDRESCEFHARTTTESNLEGICDGLDRVFLEFPNDCSRAIFCFNGLAIISTCRENTIFDIEIGDCRQGNPDTCEFYDDYTTTNIPPTTTSIPNYDELCRGRFGEFINHPTNCARVIYCHNENAIIRECQSGTIFDIMIGNCRPGDPITCDFHDVDVMTPTQEENVLKALCKGHHFNYIMNPKECDKAIFCLHDPPITKVCPESNVLDFDSESCVEGNQEECEYMKLVAFVVLLFGTFVKGQSNPCSGIVSGSIPHPQYCYKYYTCFLQIPTERTCGEDQIFDAETLKCVPGNQETCQQYISTTTTTPGNWTETTGYSTTTAGNWTETTGYSTTTVGNWTETTGYSTTTTRPENPEICRNVFFGARPHPTLNYLYYGCIRGNRMLYQCFDNEVFDPIINECVELCEVNDNMCMGVSIIKVLINPCNCASYVICYQETIFNIAECPAGEIFDEALGECRVGDPETCIFH